DRVDAAGPAVPASRRDLGGGGRGGSGPAARRGVPRHLPIRGHHHDPDAARSRAARGHRVLLPGRGPHPARGGRARNGAGPSSPHGPGHRVGRARARHSGLGGHRVRGGAVAAALGADSRLHRLRLVSHRSGPRDADPVRLTASRRCRRLDAMTPDGVVIGGGTAPLCAALAAREGGASVLVLEKAPEHERGGNSFFTAGGFRFAHEGLADLRRDILTDLSDEEAASIEVPPYPESQFRDDLQRVTEGLTDTDLSEHLIRRSRATVAWMRERGIRWILMHGRQSYKVGGKHRFWGGLNVEAVGGGPGLVQIPPDPAEAAGIEVRYSHAAHRLIQDGTGRVTGVQVRTPAGLRDLAARAVVIAAGGFEANPEWRTRYLGPDWDLAKGRGTPHKTGEGIRMAPDIRAPA